MSRPRPTELVNGPEVDAVPAHAFRARANADARRLAAADWLLRRKRDGRYLATVDARGRVQPLHPQARRHDPGLLDILARLEAGAPEGLLPIGPLQGLLRSLGVPGDYGPRHGLALVPEPARLALAGRDRFGRPLFLAHRTAGAWQRLRDAARRDGVVLEAISGFRGHHYQLGIFRRKLARGQRVDDILAVNAAPGYSEHHSGRALDIGTPGEPAAEESFESTPAFAWLRDHAGAFGFRLSYPRDNPHGITYEPWHWYHAGPAQDVRSASAA